MEKLLKSENFFFFLSKHSSNLLKTQLLKLGTVNTQVQFGIKMWFSNSDDTLNF